MTLAEIATALGLPIPNVTDKVMDFLKGEHLAEIRPHKEIDYNAAALSRILAYYRKKGLDLRSCHPRDILDQVIDTARFLQRKPALEPDPLEMACESYFVKLNAEGVPAS